MVRGDVEGEAIGRFCFLEPSRLAAARCLYSARRGWRTHQGSGLSVRLGWRGPWSAGLLWV